MASPTSGREVSHSNFRSVRDDTSPCPCVKSTDAKAGHHALLCMTPWMTHKRESLNLSHSTTQEQHDTHMCASSYEAQQIMQICPVSNLDEDFAVGVELFSLVMLACGYAGLRIFGSRHACSLARACSLVRAPTKPHMQLPTSMPYKASPCPLSNPTGQWNTYHIRIDHKKNNGIVKLNNVLINEFPLSGKIWDSLVKESKFSRSKDFEYLGDERWYGFAKNQYGHICLQDHPGKAFFKNIQIRELD